MDIIGTKVLIAMLFGLIRFIFGVLPIKIYLTLKKRTETNSKYVNDETKRGNLEQAMALVQSFGGGVLFATCFLRMIPEVYQAVNEELQSDYPYSQLLVSIGFFAVYFVEEIVHWLIFRETRESCDDGSDSRVSSSTALSKNNKILPIVTKILNDSVLEMEKKEKLKKLQYFKNLTLSADAEENPQECEKGELQDNLSIGTIVDSVDREVQTETINSVNFSDDNSDIDDIAEEEVKTQLKVLRCFVTVVAFSFDAVLEGLVIGLQHSASNLWYLFAGVSVHSATLLFCVSLEAVMVGMQEKTTLIQLAMLSGTTPVGVLLGVVISVTTETRTNVKSAAIIVLEGLAAGTVLYVTFFEALNREKERRTCRLKRAICIATGFTLMALLECLKTPI